MLGFRIRFLLLFCFIHTSFTLFLQGEDVVKDQTWLKNAHEVAWTPFDEDRDPLPVELTATVTFVDPSGTVFLEDETGATYLRANQRAKDYWPGQVLHIKGSHSKGLYIQGITFDQVEILEQTELSPAKKLTWRQMNSGAYHYQRVQVSGIVRAVQQTGEHTATLRLAIEDQILEVRIDLVKEALEPLVDANLQVEGLLAGAINDRGQLLSPYVRVADNSALKVLSPAPDDPFGIPLTRLKDLKAKPLELGSQHRLKLEGVIHKIDVLNGYILHTEDGSILVEQNLTDEWTQGEKVQMIGFPRMGTFSLFFENAETKSLAEIIPVQPDAISEVELKSGAKNYTWITLKGQAASTPSSTGSFELKMGNTLLQVIAAPEQVRGINFGAIVELSGVLVVTQTYSKDYRAHPAAFELRVSPDDELKILNSGPWLTTTHLKWGLAILTFSALGFALWVHLLRRQVQQQLKLLQSNLARELVMEERTRIAREFHDTLEQELAGASIRLDTVKAITTDERAKPMIEELRSLLVNMQHETRNFVFNLREQLTHEEAFEDNLQQLVDHLQATTPVPLNFTFQGDIPSVPGIVQHHLLRIAREAIHNSIKYAQPQKISVDLQSHPEQLKLEIKDDGAGFSTDLKSLPLGHYGVKGLHERASKIGAHLQIQSNPEEGTIVSLTLPLPIQPLSKNES